MRHSLADAFFLVAGLATCGAAYKLTNSSLDDPFWVWLWPGLAVSAFGYGLSALVDRVIAELKQHRQNP